MPHPNYSELANWNGSLEQEEISSTNSPGLPPTSYTLASSSYLSEEDVEAGSDILYNGMKLPRADIGTKYDLPQTGSKVSSLNLGRPINETSAASESLEDIISPDILGALSLVTQYESSSPAPTSTSTSPPPELAEMEKHPDPNSNTKLQENIVLENMELEHKITRESDSEEEVDSMIEKQIADTSSPLRSPSRPSSSKRVMLGFEAPAMYLDSCSSSGSSPQNLPSGQSAPNPHGYSLTRLASSSPTPDLSRHSASSSPASLSIETPISLEEHATPQRLIPYVSIPPFPKGSRKEDYAWSRQCLKNGSQTNLRDALSAAFTNNAYSNSASELKRKRSTQLKGPGDAVPQPKRPKRQIIAYSPPATPQPDYDRVRSDSPFDIGSESSVSLESIVVSARHLVAELELQHNSSELTSKSWRTSEIYYDIHGVAQTIITPQSQNNMQQSTEGSSGTSQEGATSSRLGQLDESELQLAFWRPATTSRTLNMQDDLDSPSTSPRQSLTRREDQRLAINAKGLDTFHDDSFKSHHSAIQQAGSDPDVDGNEYAAERPEMQEPVAWKSYPHYENFAGAPSMTPSSSTRNNHNDFLDSFSPPENVRLDSDNNYHRSSVDVSNNLSPFLAEPGSASFDDYDNINSMVLGEASGSADPFQANFTNDGTIDPSLLGGSFLSPDPPQSPLATMEIEEVSMRLSHSPTPFMSQTSDASYSYSAPSIRRRKFPDRVSSPSPSSRKRPKLMLSLSRGKHKANSGVRRTSPASSNEKRNDVSYSSASEVESSDDDIDHELDPDDSMYEPPVSLKREDDSVRTRRGGRKRGRGGARDRDGGGAGFRSNSHPGSAKAGSSSQSAEGSQLPSAFAACPENLVKSLSEALSKGTPQFKKIRGPESFCHHCRRRTTLAKMTCTASKEDGSTCGMHYCVSCITKRYPDITFNTRDREFSCPRCCNTCNCTVCSRGRGEKYISEHVLRRSINGVGMPKVSPRAPRSQTLKTRTPKSRIQTTVGTGPFWGTVYGVSGEKLGAAFVASSTPKKRVFIGTPLDEWRLDLTTLRDEIDESNVPYGPVKDDIAAAHLTAYIGDASNLASYVPMASLQKQDRSLSPLTDMSDGDGEDRRGSHGGLVQEDAAIGDYRFDLGITSPVLRRVITDALSAATQS